MSLHCTICYDSLVTENMPVATLGCGHTYHKLCITQWMASKTSPACPLCKKKIVKSKMVSPVYFSTNDEAYVPAPSDSSETVAHIVQVQNENLHLKTTVDTFKKKSLETELEINQLKAELLRVQSQRRYIKIIKKVAELDDDLSEEHIQTYLSTIKDLPPKELLVYIGALRARQLKAIRDGEDNLKRYELRSRENEHLKQKIARLSMQLRKGKQDNSLPFNKLNSRIQQKNVIVLDDSDDDDNDDNGESSNILNYMNHDKIPNYINDDENDDDDDDFLVEEHITMVPRKRRNDFFEPEQSEKRNNTVAIDLSQDDADLQAGPSEYSA